MLVMPSHLVTPSTAQKDLRSQIGSNHRVWPPFPVILPFPCTLPVWIPHYSPISNKERRCLLETRPWQRLS